MARPVVDIDAEIFESLCRIQCTKQEICDFFKISPKTISAWCKRTYGKSFNETFDGLRGKGRASLRRNQWALGETNPTMAVWLGKQYLGQRDKPATKHIEITPNDPENEISVDDLYGDDEP